ncbi:MAG: MarR family winged helix-turn-helix transcriptional regulator [Paracoccus sp. (in: a-proteobacteria)]
MSIFDDSPLTPDEQRAIGASLHRASRALRQQFEARTRDGALSSTQWLALVLLKKHGPMRQARLAELTGVEPISISRTIDRMQKGGWVTRQPDPDDRRAHLVCPTAQAERSLGGIDAAAQDIFAGAFKGFSAAELRGLADMLGRLNANLGAGSECASAAGPKDRS